MTALDRVRAELAFAGCDGWCYAELIDRAGPAGERHASTISLSLDMKAAARQIRTAGGGIRGAAAVLRFASGRAREVLIAVHVRSAR